MLIRLMPGKPTLHVVLTETPIREGRDGAGHPATISEAVRKAEVERTASQAPRG